MNIEKGCKCCSFNLDSIRVKSSSKINSQKLGPSTTTVPINSDTNIFIRGLSWGGTKWNWSQGSTNKLKYYFGTAATSANCPAGVTALNGGAITTENWTDDEKSAMRVGLKKWTDIIGMETEEVFNVEDTDLRFYVTEDSSVGYYGAQFGPHSQPHQGTGIYRRFSGNTWTDSLQPGGFGFITIIHELGHAMGLAHPHDSGGGSINFPGVSNSGDKGDNNLNQNTFTVMSYIDVNSGINPTSAQSYGFCKGPMAFDIATMKFLYGLNPNYETGNNIYTITEGKVGGIDGYACIYDTSGEDMIIYNGTKKVTIDLRPATITNQIGGGGFISKVDDTDIFSGYTIANGGVIEKATGGSNDDTIYQPESVENILDGRNGVDKVVYKMNFSDYVITDLSSNNDGSYVTVTKDNVTDTLYNIEKIEFSDGIIDTNNIEDPQDYSLYSSDIQSPGLTINADNTTVFNEITITTNENTITNLDVVLDEITHTWVGDLKITLTNMNTGTSLILLNKAGDTTYGSSGNDFIGTVFSDSGTVSIDSITPDQNPYTGIYYPHDNENRTYLNKFNGEQINSTWRLTIEDTYSSLDHGLFVKWSLRFKPKETVIIDKPKINGPSEISIYENSNFVHTYTSSESVTWSINGGNDSSLFEINPLNGYLNFKNMVDYDNPSDSDGNNIYNVIIRATGSTNNFRDLSINVTVLNLDDSTLSSNTFTKVNASNSNYLISTEDGTGRI